MKSKPIKVLYTIPNFDTAGSKIVLYKILAHIDKSRFEPHVMVLHNRGYWYKRVTQLGIPTHTLNFTHRMRPILEGIKHCWKVSRFFKEKQFDIIYSFHYHADYSEPLAARMAGIPWIYVKKNMGWFGANHNAWRLRSFLANEIVVQNTDMLKEFFPNSRKTHYIPIGVDTNEFFPYDLPLEFYQKNGLIPSDFNIISVSSLLPIKGVDLILHAFSRFQSKIQNSKLIIVGDDSSEYAGQLKTLAKELHINENVIFAGSQNNINEWLNASDLFIQATKNEGRREGAPIALQEAMAAGCIVLGSRVAGIKDQLGTCPELLFTAGNIDELTTKINWVFSFNDLQKENYKKILMELINNRYSLDLEIQNHQHLLTKTVNPSH